MRVNFVNKNHLLAALSSIRLVLMDIDGTLVRGPVDTLDNVLNQLRRLRARGIQFSVATGRTLVGAKRVLDRFQTTHAKLPALVAYNGGVIAIPEPQGIIERNIIGPDCLPTLFGAIAAIGIDALIYTCDAHIDLSPVERVFGLKRGPGPRKEFNGMDVEYEPLEQLSRRTDVIAVLGITDFREQAERYKVKLQSVLSKIVQITTSGNCFIEIASNRTNKLAGLKRLCDLLDLRPESVMSIGDNYNDKEMLEGSGIGIAVGNAPKEVKSVAHYVCDQSGAEGVVEALRLLMEAKRLSTIARKAGVE